MKVSSKEIIQSYLITSAKYDFSIHEKRIIYRIIELAQADLKGKKLDKNYSISKTLFEDRIVKIPISALLKNGEGNNHEQVKKALTSLRNKTLEYETEKTWKLIGVIEKPKFEKFDSYITFEVQPEIWNALLSFNSGKGHSKYEIQLAMSFSSVYSMRFYELFSKNMKPMTLSIETLKERFKIEHKYKNRPSNFINKVIDVAKKELDEKSDYSFNYSTKKEGRKVTKILFVPVYIPANRPNEKVNNELQKQISLRYDFSSNLLKYLNDLGFSEQGIRNNLPLFRKINEKGDLYGFVSKIKRNSQNAKNPQGYIISAMRTYLDKMDFTVKIDEKERNKMNVIFDDLTSKFKI